MEKHRQRHHRKDRNVSQSLCCKSLKSIEKIQPRMMIATFNDKPCTTIITCFSLSNNSDKTNLITFYNELPSLVPSIHKYNALMFSGDMNAQIGEDESNKFLHNSTKGNEEHLMDSSLENEQTCLNTKFQKMVGKL